VDEALAAGLGGLGRLLQEPTGLEQQVVEVEQRAGLEARRVGGRDRVQRLRVLPPLDRERRRGTVLPARDPGLDGRRAVALEREARLLEHGLHEPRLVLAVGDREVGIDADRDAVATQQPRAEAVERARPDPRAPGKPVEPALQHVRGLVGEGEREQRVPREAAGDEPRGPAREHAGLPRARAGDDQERPARVRDRLALGRVQVLEEGLAEPGRGKFA
jgi:hypothetical protein